MSEHRRRGNNSALKQHIYSSIAVFAVATCFILLIVTEQGMISLNTVVSTDLYFHRVTFKPPKEVIIKDNYSVSGVARMLKTRGIVDNERDFIDRFLRQSHYIHSGVYLFRENLKAGEAVKFFQNYKKHLDVNFTLNLYKETNPIAVYGRLVKISECEQCIKKFIEDNQIPSGSINGLLKQNIYYLYPKFDVYTFLQKNTAEYLGMIRSNQTTSTDPKVVLNMYQVLIAASLVQAEGNGQIDTDSKIASVIFNRLERNMPLQLDSTVFFATQHYGYFANNDKYQYNPYNTYVIMGLPPTPITWVSGESIRAVKHPATTNYLYFYSNKDKSYYFTDNKDEFFKHVAEDKGK